jgi:hypothetical protein
MTDRISVLSLQLFTRLNRLAEPALRSVMVRISDLTRTSRHVSVGPEGDKVRRGKRAYSITSSASAITGAGISRPMALAVFRFITNR